jgi:hypothetical protein
LIRSGELGALPGHRYTTVGIVVENNVVYVDDIWRSLIVHGADAPCTDLSRLSSTGFEMMDASVDGARMLSSPGSTVAMTTDETLFSFTHIDRNNHQDELVDHTNHPRAGVQA